MTKVLYTFRPHRNVKAKTYQKKTNSHIFTHCKKIKEKNKKSKKSALKKIIIKLLKLLAFRVIG